VIFYLLFFTELSRFHDLGYNFDELTLIDSSFIYELKGLSCQLQLNLSWFFYHFFYSISSFHVLWDENWAMLFVFFYKNIFFMFLSLFFLIWSIYYHYLFFYHLVKIKKKLISPSLVNDSSYIIFFFFKMHLHYLNIVLTQKKHCDVAQVHS